MLKSILLRDMRNAWCASGSAASGMAFFGMSYVLMVMAFDPTQLHAYRLPLLAICILLTVMLTLPSILDEDARDGSMEQYLLLPIARSWLMFIKMLAYWLSHILPVLVLVYAIQWAEQGDVQILRLILMSLWLTAIGGLSATLSLMHGKGTVARALVMIPLYLPALIAATLIDASANILMMQIAATLLLWPITAWIGGYLLTLAVE